MIRVFIFSIFILFCAAAQAANKQAATISLAAGNVPQQIKTIESLLDSKEYSELSKENRVRLESQFDLLLSPDFETASGPDIEANINQLLSKAFADSKLTCVYEKPVGTNLKKRVCTTAAAKERANEIVRRDGISVSN